jgi:hypothetical protein
MKQQQLPTPARPIYRALLLVARPLCRPWISRTSWPFTATVAATMMSTTMASIRRSRATSGSRCLRPHAHRVPPTVCALRTVSHDLRVQRSAM